MRESRCDVRILPEVKDDEALAAVQVRSIDPFDRAIAVARNAGYIVSGTLRICVDMNIKGFPILR